MQVLKVLIEGIQMTDNNLQKTFQKFGVVQYAKVGDDFDPAMHDALFRVPSAEIAPNKIGQVCTYTFTCFHACMCLYICIYVNFYV